MTKNDIFNLNYSIDSSTQTIEELWESLAKFAQSRAKDNLKYDGCYPLEIREIQLPGLKSLVEAIEITHQKMMRDSTVANNLFPVTEEVRGRPNIHDLIPITDSRVLVVGWRDVWSLLAASFDCKLGYDSRPYVLDANNLPVRALVRYEFQDHEYSKPKYVGRVIDYFENYVHRNNIQRKGAYTNYRHISLVVLNLSDCKSKSVVVHFPDSGNLPELKLEIDLTTDMLTLYW